VDGVPSFSRYASRMDRALMVSWWRSTSRWTRRRLGVGFGGCCGRGSRRRAGRTRHRRPDRPRRGTVTLSSSRQLGESV